LNFIDPIVPHLEMKYPPSGINYITAIIYTTPNMQASDRNKKIETQNPAYPPRPLEIHLFHYLHRL